MSPGFISFIPREQDGTRCGVKSVSPGSVKSPRTTIACLCFVSASHSARMAGPQEQKRDQQGMTQGWCGSGYAGFDVAGLRGRKRPGHRVAAAERPATSRSMQSPLPGLSGVERGARNHNRCSAGPKGSERLLLLSKLGSRETAAAPTPSPASAGKLLRIFPA